MKRTNNCEFKYIDNIPTATVTKAFLKEAETIGSDAFETLVKLRNDHQGLQVRAREIAKNEDKVSYEGLTYGYMREFIEAREGDNAAAVLEKLEKTIELSKSFRAPYLYVRNWFLKMYGKDLPRYMKKNGDTLDNTAEDMNDEQVS